MSTEEPKKPTKATSSRKIEANRRNAQLSTGPKTDEGKAKSSRNSITHGVFVKKFLDGATPETVAEIEELAAGLRDYYKPQGIVEEILVQKIVVETARYGRELALEQPAPGYNLTRVVHCLDRISRYSTATSRALYRAIEGLERLRPHGKLARAVPFQRIRKRLRHLRKPTRSNSRNRVRKTL